MKYLNEILIDWTGDSDIEDNGIIKSDNVQKRLEGIPEIRDIEKYIKETLGKFPTGKYDLPSGISIENNAYKPLTWFKISNILTNYNINYSLEKLKPNCYARKLGYEYNVEILDFDGKPIKQKYVYEYLMIRQNGWKSDVSYILSKDDITNENRSFTYDMQGSPLMCDIPHRYGNDKIIFSLENQVNTFAKYIKSVLEMLYEN